MPLQTDFNVTPYNDDFDPNQQYYKVLFKPSVAIQARELNYLQSILQNQIEKFGDNVFKRGTIIEGCNLILHSSLPYIKIKDLEVDGTPVVVDDYANYYAKNSTNLTALIVKPISGFESQAPDLNTLYLRYNNSGDNANTAAFSANQTLTIYDPANPIFKINVINGSSGFVNTDTIIVMSSIAIQNATGGSTFANGAFDVGDHIRNGIANAVIVETNSTVNSEVLILKIRPLAEDLQTANSILWKFNTSENIINANTANTAKIVETIGSGAEASLVTDRLGKITSITVTNTGEDYHYLPYITVSITSESTITTSEIEQLNAVPQNYLTSIYIANDAQDPVGYGYGVTVDEGTIFQKGYFSKVSKQLLVVNKYDNTDFDKSVGFYTAEDIVNSDQDPTLLDGAQGTLNYTAPGADRLKLTPNLVVIDKEEADANADFFPIIEFAAGLPYRQNKQTVFNVIGDELAKRTFEESGNYVLDQFILTTKDYNNFAYSNNYFRIYIDPGTAYIRGFRVSTSTTFNATVEKGSDYVSLDNGTVRINYGSFVKVKELAGNFPFNTGDRVRLYDSPKSYISGANTATGLTSSSANGNIIGYARIRSLILESGAPGSPEAIYRMYLFDVEREPGKNFADVRSILYHNGTDFTAWSDVDLKTGNALLEDLGQTYSGLLVKAFDAVKSANAVNYTYRTIGTSHTASSNGLISIAQPVGSFFPYSGELGSVAKSEIIVIPKEAYQGGANVSGTITVTANSYVMTGTGDFQAIIERGDFLKIDNGTANAICQVNTVTNTTHLTLTQPVPYAISTPNVKLYYPKNIPITLNKSGRSANVAGDGSLNINLDTTFQNPSTGSSSTANVIIQYNLTANSAGVVTKQNNRGLYARINCSNASTNTVGPWSIGVPDVFRLRGVWSANGANTVKTFNTTTGTIITTDVGAGEANSYIIISSGNPYANGDLVTYTVSGANTIGGLSNGASYYVVNSNSTALSLASTRGGTKVAFTTRPDNETHTIFGYPLYFTPNTFGVTDVTNDFYIDHNQTEDFLDISYLYKKPRKSAISNNTVLLVQFDCFNTVGSGIKTISSYSIDDSKDLTALVVDNDDIHTMEIPEVFGKNDKYYDLRDFFDFRPIVANTIPLTSTITSNAVINPGESSSLTRIEAIDWKFPLPNSNLSADIEYYLGRTDRVVLDNNGRFTILKGFPGSTAAPPEPANVITIQYLNIPPYPSLPASLSEKMAKIVDTKIANEKFAKKRATYFKITTPIDADQRSRIQVKNYKMADIANIERRIKDLEYYVSFTLAEAIAKARYIPSSLDNVTDRFKFGYFVDPFTDYSFADTTNPEFYATIENDYLVPKKNELNIEFEYEDFSKGGSSVSTLDFDEYNFIAQLDATDGPINAANTANTGTTLSTVTQTTATVIQSYITQTRRDSPPYVYEEFYYTFSSLANIVRFFLNARDNNIAAEIFQSTTPNGPWVSTINSSIARAITSADITQYSLRGVDQLNRKYEHPGSLTRKGYGPVGGFLEDQFKMTWTHDPSFGQYVKIRIYKGYNHGSANDRQGGGKYAYKMFYPTDTITNSTMIVSDPNNFEYVGIVTKIDPPTFNIISPVYWGIGYGWDYNSDWVGEPDTYFSDTQKFIVNIVGLKPNTAHKFYFENEDRTTKCLQLRSTTGSTSSTDLISDGNGLLNFEFYYDSGVDDSGTDFEQVNRLTSSISGLKRFVVQSTDRNSRAGGQIGIKTYAQINQSKVVSSFKPPVISQENPTSTGIIRTGDRTPVQTQPVLDGTGTTSGSGSTTTSQGPTGSPITNPVTPPAVTAEPSVTPPNSTGTTTININEPITQTNVGGGGFNKWGTEI